MRPLPSPNPRTRRAPRRLRVPLLLLCLGCGPDRVPVAHDSGVDGLLPREACATQDPRGLLLWGDLHVHTAWSFDAWVYDVRLQPDDAYRFAQGDAVTLPNGAQAQLRRPLDFAAVTDHSEYMGEVAACSTPGATGYDTSLCQGYRDADAQSVQLFGVRLASADPERMDDICDSRDAGCNDATDEGWARIQSAAETHLDRTAACAFTTFVGYEWSGATGVSNLHRNVLFANERVPAVPASYFEATTPDALWDALGSDCLDAGDGCDVLAIPHNSNLSNGRMFAPTAGWSADIARDRAALEPVMEVYQHKGSSECIEGLGGLAGGEDERCDFELYERDQASDCGDETGSGGMSGLGCASRYDHLRGILLAGLEAQADVGENPYRLGVIASTDTHSGTPGAVAEDRFAGHLGNVEDDPQERLSDPKLNPGGYLDSPGGLAAVWAEENSREAIFAAFRRREVYGTSGPRISVRMYGGPDLPTDLCDQPDPISVAQSMAVPMGGTLPPGPPRILVWAESDTAGAQTPLERVEIVKGWLDDAGEPHVDVLTVAGGSSSAGVDLDTCAPTETANQRSLCTVWTDPDPQAHAVYYARVLEEPTCRWSWRDCLTIDAADRPEACDTLPQTIQERAWTSPLWTGSEG